MNFLQNSAGSSALEGNVGTSDTSVTIPFGLFGVYDASATTFGIGVIGVSSSGYAVAGESTSNTQPSLLAYPGGNGLGLEATTLSSSSSPAIYSLSKGSGAGIESAVNNPNTPALAGVVGEDLSNGSSTTDGVLGTTIQDGYGVEGTSSDGALGGVHGMATTGVGVAGEAASGNGVYGVNTMIPSASTTTPPTGQDAGVYAVSAVGDGIDAVSTTEQGIYAFSSGSAGASIDSSSTSLPALVATDESGGLIMQGQSKGNCGAPATYYAICMTLDASGNFTTYGSIVDKGTFSRTRNPQSDLVSYGDQVTEPTMEDVGTAQLVNGSATVPIAADFRQTIEGSRYMVFLTPHADSDVLYVASESPSAFVVRESHGGRATFGFDFRIVAQQYGAHEGRLPHYATVLKNKAENRLAVMAPRFRGRYSMDVAAHARKSAHSRHPFVAPPITLMPQAASFSNARPR